MHATTYMHAIWEGMDSHTAAEHGVRCLYPEGVIAVSLRRVVVSRKDGASGTCIRSSEWAPAETG